MLKRIAQLGLLMISMVPVGFVSANAHDSVNPAPTVIQQLADLQQQLAKFEVVRGAFIQTRHLEMFNQPLSSEGQFTLDKTHGLLWQQTTPFPVNLVLTQDKLRQSMGGQEAQIITSEQNPMAFYFSRVFLSVFHGDTAELEKEFTLDFATEDDAWRLTLTPKAAPLNSVFDTITLQGHQQIERLELREIRGDRTEIEFSQHQTAPETLTDAEQNQFVF